MNTLTYKISEEMYRDALQYSLKHQSKDMRQIFTEFMLTFGQLLVMVVICTSFSLPGNAAALLMALSVLLCTICLFYYIPSKLRVGMLFRQAQRNGKWVTDYEKTHRLYWKGDVLTAHYGQVTNTIRPDQITELAEHNECMYIINVEAVFEVIPLSAFSSEEKKAEFIKEIKERKFRDSMKASRERIAELTAKGYRPYVYEMRMEKYIALQSEAVRGFLKTRAAWETEDFLRLAGTAGVVGLAVLYPRWWVIIAVLLLILFFNVRYVQAYTPWLKKSVEDGIRQVASFCPETEVTLFSTEEVLYLLGDIHCLELPWDIIRASFPLSNGRAYVLPTRNIFPVSGDGKGEYVSYN